MQRTLARAGIDTFAPSLLGYGHSTRFRNGLDDPGNASLRPYLPDGSCPYPEGCDRSHLPFFRLDQQGTLLLNNPLDGQHVGRTLYAANPVLPDSAAVIAKVNRAVFAESIFGTPTEETTPSAGFSTRSDGDATWAMAPERDAVCTGHVVPGSRDQLWTQLMEEDRLGSTWGGDRANPTGVSRAPTFSSYGWNATVAQNGRFTVDASGVAVPSP
ncbi:hypothetical protein [Streptomyces vietnamensis]|uniref:Uncharacterized protein n=1 Tax=Streptomyces vietnamensis TaxID=362257 RepID=A0A0B5IFA0_9ACTN|nr:hypothetical protein [Streptomyces vietnamensis]AJF67049.1 hypothetical protein SVTN_24380 [Streptomyces vietnamensis]